MNFAISGQLFNAPSTIGLVNKTTIKGAPNSITQFTLKNGGINRNYYGPDCKQIKQVSNHDPWNPKFHPYGKNGEHAHDYIWDGDKLVDRPMRELTDIERKLPV